MFLSMIQTAVLSTRQNAFKNSAGIVVRLKSNWNLDRDDPCAGCRRALVDIPKPKDPDCKIPCDSGWTKPKGILHKIKLKMLKGGSNFGTPFWRVHGKQVCKPKKSKPPEKTAEKPKSEPQPTLMPVPEPKPGLQVSLVGAEGAVGQYMALLLKQCPAVKRLRLYEATCPTCSRDMYNVVEDLRHIDTNCVVQAYSCHSYELDLCLENSDIVVLLEGLGVDVSMSACDRFNAQAAFVKQYADSISRLCPRAFVIVCTSPIDCMVPLVAEVFKGVGYYNPRKLIGSLALPEMRASSLAGNALALDPRITRVPCVGGTEGDALVPLFSKAIEQFQFSEEQLEFMTRTVRDTSKCVQRCEQDGMRSAELSEAYALAGLVNNVALALLCQNVPRLSAFVEPDPCTTISPTRFMGNKVEINGTGVCRNLGLPPMTELETKTMDNAITFIEERIGIVKEWYKINYGLIKSDDRTQNSFFSPRKYGRLQECKRYGTN